MTSLYLSMAGSGNDQVVHRPRATDAIGAALRGVFGDGPTPAEMTRLIERLDRVR